MSGEQLAVSGRRSLAQRQDRVELLELADPERRADVVDAVVVAEPRVIEPAAAVGATLVAHADEPAPGFLVVRRDHPALAGRHLLVRIEGEHRVDAVRADPAALVLRSERLAGVLDQHEAVLLAQLAQRVELAGIAEDVDRDDPLRPLGDRGLDGGRVEVHRPLVDVGEDRRRPLVDEAVGRGDERVRRRDHLVALLEARRSRRAGAAPRCPDDTAAAYGAPTFSAKSSSKRSIAGPSESRPDRSTSRTSSSSRSSMYGDESGICRMSASHASAGALSPTVTRSSQ